jgi:hypothetical protein
VCVNDPVFGQVIRCITRDNCVEDTLFGNPTGSCATIADATTDWEEAVYTSVKDRPSARDQCDSTPYHPTSHPMGIEGKPCRQSESSTEWSVCAIECVSGERQPVLPRCGGIPPTAVSGR